eukprot:7380289-Prymnesium_polylepis.1
MARAPGTSPMMDKELRTPTSAGIPRPRNSSKKYPRRKSRFFTSLLCAWRPHCITTLCSILAAFGTPWDSKRSRVSVKY